MISSACALLVVGQLKICDGARPVLPSSMTPPEETAEDTAYNKYETYPPYCSTPDEMEKRAVPPLSQGTINDDSSRLVHVTALIRHGARTPYSGAPAYQCWNGYWEDEETGVWNCDLKTYMSPPATTKEKGGRQALLDSEGLLEEVSVQQLFCETFHIVHTVTQSC